MQALPLPRASTHLACKTSPGKEPTGQRSFSQGLCPPCSIGLLPPWIQALTSRHLLEEVFPDYPTTFFKRSSLTTPRVRMPIVFCSLIQRFFSFRARITIWLVPALVYYLPSLPPHPSGSYQTVVSIPHSFILSARSMAWHTADAQYICFWSEHVKK